MEILMKTIKNILLLATLIAIQPILAMESPSDLNYKLCVAARLGNLDTVQQLIQDGAFINAQVQDKKFTALGQAVCNGHEAIVRLLLDNGANVNLPIDNKHDGTPLMSAAEKGRLAVVKLLLVHKAEVNIQTAIGTRQVTALHQAAQNGHDQVVALLLEHGACIEAISLIMAAEGGHLKVMEILLKNGANPDAQSEDCQHSALRQAAQEGHYQVVKLLLENGANPDQPSTNRFTPLMITSENGHSSIASLLLAHHANVDATTQNNHALTSLMIAAIHDKAQVIPVLLNAGADLSARSLGDTALMLTAEYGKRDAAISLLTTIRGCNHESIKNYFTVWLVQNRLSAESNQSPELPRLPTEIWDMITTKLIESIIKDQLPSMVDQLIMVNNANRTAHEIAHAKNHLELCELLDLNNSAGMNTLCAHMGRNIMRIIFSKPADKI
jgi:ankyrin repeat protein